MTSQPDEMRYDTRDWVVAKQLLDEITMIKSAFLVSFYSPSGILRSTGQPPASPKTSNVPGPTAAGAQVDLGSVQVARHARTRARAARAA